MLYVAQQQLIQLQLFKHEGLEGKARQRYRKIKMDLYKQKEGIHNDTPSFCLVN
ncbi:hypothetical protein [Bacillus sp. 491mf]|uniref:hypothetical protein n=1 Tax=Bacillus sp. 491mf TaxID=1761755 RepID=UPI001C434280|nr:hypothetical protein [Bacillus sp. 491mf]